MVSRNLVVIRCGEHSLHSEWLSASRHWDLAVSYFGADNEREFPEAVQVHRYKGGKWDGLHAYFQDHPDTLNHYDFFWFPDDDIRADSGQIDTLFELTANHGFELAQPSLSADSYLSHLITLNNPLFEYRLVNFVELMVPVFSQSLLKKVLPLFEHARSGFGLDFLWHRFTSEPKHVVAIVDLVEVVHTRPVGGALHRMIALEGMETPQQERDRILSVCGDLTKTQMTFGGKLRCGLKVHGRIFASAIAAVGWALDPTNRRQVDTVLEARYFLHWIRREFYSSLFCPAPLGRIDPAEHLENMLADRLPEMQAARR
ncbi:DUF707 domain-containing protein [Methylocystis sp.]|uniref:DUF707 domain-containing protein n=1 Tax=Methylocystis sp. TaxID=1911079 RepID=UPI003D1432F7